jgi:hypothetical protein
MCAFARVCRNALNMTRRRNHRFTKISPSNQNKAYICSVSSGLSSESAALLFKIKKIYPPDPGRCIMAGYDRRRDQEQNLAVTEK